MEPNTKQMIHNDIVQDIIKGEYRHNGLLSERRLMEKYGTSKSVVREALVELCNENVLRSIPRYGYEIVTLTENDVRNILQFRVMVECQSLPIIFKKASPEELANLVVQMQSLSPTGDQDVWDAWDNNTQFHLQLLALSGNRYCYSQIKRSLLILKRAYAQFYWDKWRRVRFNFNSETHLRITDAMQAGDLALATRLLEDDINSFSGTL
jgi:DNA-binding GntR family transcriptional regulator